MEKNSFMGLIGIWKTTGEIKSGGTLLKLIGTDSYELILDGTFILHRADVEMGGERSETMEIIKLDDSGRHATMHYFNSKGENGQMLGSIINSGFKIEGEGLRFNGTIKEENTKISGKWSIRTETGEWEDFIDINLEKQTS